MKNSLYFVFLMLVLFIIPIRANADYLAGDINHDYCINLEDLSVVALDWLKCSDMNDSQCQGVPLKTTVTMDDQAQHDARVWSWIPDRALGATATDLGVLKSGDQNYEGTGTGIYLASVIQWDLDVPEGTQIDSVDSAQVVLRAFNDCSGGTFKAYRLTESFDEATACWNNRPSYDSSAYVSFNGVAVTESMTLDVSNLLANNGSKTTFGLMVEIVTPNDSSNHQFMASEYTAYSNVTPSLTATFDVNGYGQGYLNGDINRDYYVNMKDFSVMAQGWLKDSFLSVDIVANKDSLTAEWSPTTNYGSSSYLYMSPGEYGFNTRLITGSAGCTIIEFDLPHTPGEFIKAVNYAKLRLHSIGIAAGTRFRLFRLLESFTESAVTWNTRPDVFPDTYVYWTSTTDGGGSMNGDIVEIDVTPLLADVGSDQTFGIVIQQETGSGQNAFYSRNNSGWPSYGITPQLLAEYGTDENPPVTTLTAEITLRPSMNTFKDDETVVINFEASGLTYSTTLDIEVFDNEGTTIDTDTLNVAPDEDGSWNESWVAPSSKLGFYRVWARLGDNVTTLPKKGTCLKGCITYAVVIDPNDRPLYDKEETFFGVCGGYFPQWDVLSFLGGRWIWNMAYRWDYLEPVYGGQYADARAAAAPDPYPGESLSWPKTGTTQQQWVTFELPGLHGVSNMVDYWAVDPNTVVTLTGAIKPECEDDWENFCTEVADNFTDVYPSYEYNPYQITWEPNPTWGWAGTDEQLVRIYELAYPKLHAEDPHSVVIGPTLANMDIYNPYVTNLLDAGLGSCIDGLAMHAYTRPDYSPPEVTLLPAIRNMKTDLASRGLSNLGLYNTESGWRTSLDPWKEDILASWIIRSHLIMLGEGFRMSLAFYTYDYPGDDKTYGFYYQTDTVVPEWHVYEVMPKPVVPAYAAMTSLVEGYTSVSAIESFGGEVFGYSYYRGTDVILALWDYGDTPDEVVIDTGVSSVEVYDFMGNKTAVTANPDDEITVQLTNKPIYIKGVSYTLWGP